MACRYYDDLVVGKLQKWFSVNQKVRVLKPDETKRFFEMTADDNNDTKFKLPLITVARSTDVEIELNIKNLKSFSGLPLYADAEKTVQLNVIPIKLSYQIDIYTKTFEEADEYLRELLFKLINNPKLVISIPYNDSDYQHVAYLRVLNSVNDTSSISERLFPGQFTRWTIQLELQDGFLFSVPYRQNWKLYLDDLECLPVQYMSCLDVKEELPDTIVEERSPFDIEGPFTAEPDSKHKELE